MTPIGIYIHVPFCARKCPYCDFYSCAYNLTAAEKYTDAVIRDIKNLPDNIYADTLYFGGGTPSLLSADMLNKILDALSHHCHFINPEITLEVNPCTVTEEKLFQYSKIGINRLSFGVQSVHNDELKFLGRMHSWEKAKKIINSAQSIGFKNISCDIMIGLSGQSIEKLKLTIHKIAELSIQHFSAYILKIEENTPFNTADIINSLPDDDHISDLYLFMVEELQKLGYNQYEISNFSKMGFESKHNLKYWKCQEYIGLGPSAHSYFNGKRYFIPSDLNKYLNSTETILTDENPGSDDEKIMLGLRLTEGININDFPSRKALFLEKAKVFNKFNLIEIKNNFIKLTPKGFLVSNSIINEFI